MRTPADRLRHAISFEIIGIIIATPLAALFFHLPGESSAVIVVVSASVAMVWNYLYNWGFDRLMQRLRGTTAKTPSLRVLHAILFEGGLLVLMLPLVAWYLDISLWAALLLDFALAGFYVVYAFVFNWAYDRLFPLPEWQADGAGGSG